MCQLENKKVNLVVKCSLDKSLFASKTKKNELSL